MHQKWVIYIHRLHENLKSLQIDSDRDRVVKPSLNYDLSIDSNVKVFYTLSRNIFEIKSRLEINFNFSIYERPGLLSRRKCLLI